MIRKKLRRAHRCNSALGWEVYQVMHAMECTASYSNEDWQKVRCWIYIVWVYCRCPFHKLLCSVVVQFWEARACIRKAFGRGVVFAARAGSCNLGRLNHWLLRSHTIGTLTAMEHYVLRLNRDCSNQSRTTSNALRRCCSRWDLSRMAPAPCANSMHLRSGLRSTTLELCLFIQYTCIDKIR